VSNYKEYQINKISDFLRVPKDKQAECLRDFSCWLDMCRKGDEIQAELAAEFPGVNASLNLDGFVWVDDSIKGISDFSFTVDGKEIARASGDNQ
jgi:hypothetical protein